MHSAVEFADGAVIAQLGLPDMRLPIQYALTWPARVPCKVPRLSLTESAKLTFYAPDYEAFPALGWRGARRREKGDRGAVLNGANEAAVGLFLDGQIGFTDIAARVAQALDAIPYQQEVTLDGRPCGGRRCAQAGAARNFSPVKGELLLLQIILAILAFGMLVIVHEFGHFITAKRGGVQVNEFWIGMGPTLLKKQHNGTLYCLKLLPFGGACVMEGEDSESDNAHAFGKASLPRRMLIVAAGALMNFLIGFLIVLAVTRPNGPNGGYIVSTLRQVDPASTAAAGRLAGRGRDPRGGRLQHPAAQRF